MKLKIKTKVMDSLCLNKNRIEIYSDKLIYKGTIYNELKLDLKENTLYKIYTYSNIYPFLLIRNIYLYKDETIFLNFYQHYFKIRLIDSNYNNLKIEKGEIILCPKDMLSM